MERKHFNSCWITFFYPRRFRVQANTDPDNKVSQHLLEKMGFEKEGVSRKSSFARGQWRDECHYGILREEWKEPKILTKTT
jgi:RimJ/RimL family protein N-acetyltransferase